MAGTAGRIMMSAHDFAAACVHESAHALVAVATGGRLTALTVTPVPTGSHAGHVEYSTPPGITLPENEIAYAGLFAESVFDSNGGRPAHRTLLAALAANPDDRTALLDHRGTVALPREIEPVLLDLMPSVLTVAATLATARQGRLPAPHRQVAAVLGMSPTSGPLIRGSLRNSGWALRGLEAG
ncbi:hypothetical protein VZC37_22900 [Gordonia sp. LSe1-13]|uniref:Uncharacterized protein n=1 Tax=Gordonia sesuvii TaxID=3116777 RepID=A0ABU7MJD3_9ACTN|nr:hypothetical protein [Gordonia sp. LSe1-13]